ncbi:MAG: hypothetical protein LC689_03115 [Myxococcales bacterium]|nr:hypothetical protein [Myxococcales bacterium]
MRQHVAQAIAMTLAFVGCTTAPAKTAAHSSPKPPPAPETCVWCPQFSPQPGEVIAEVGDTPVLALAAPRFAQLGRDQRLLAYWTSQAAAGGDAVALDQNYRHNLAIARVLRGILSRPQVVPPALLGRIRAYARVFWLNHGVHDYETGRKQAPPFTLSDLRVAALAAQAAGADLGNGPVSIEYALRALEGPLFDPRVDPLRTSHGGDLTASAVNLYAGVTQRDLRGFRERFPLNSRLVKEDRDLTEEIQRVPAVAAAFDRAATYAAPPQRAVLEPLSEFLRTGQPETFEAAERAWLEAAGPVDFFAGFLDRSADPRNRKAIFGAMVGLADPEHAGPLDAIAQAVKKPVALESLTLASASGALRPLRSFALTVGNKSAVFAGAEEAVGRVRDAEPVLADPAVAADLRRCGPALRFAVLALREMSRTPQDEVALEEARAEASAHALSADPALAQIVTPRCQALWPQFAAASWFASQASVPQGDRVEDDRQRAIQLQIWWFTGKGALAERHVNGRRSLAATDAGRFRKAAAELVALVDEIARLGDTARAADLLERHASHIDRQWRDEAVDRLRAAGVPRRVAVIPPEIRGVVTDGKVTDAEAVPVDDLDTEILRSWAGL